MHVSGLSMLLTIRTYDWEVGYCMHVSTTVYAADNTYIRLGYCTQLVLYLNHRPRTFKPDTEPSPSYTATGITLKPIFFTLAPIMNLLQII